VWGSRRTTVSLALLLLLGLAPTAIAQSGSWGTRARTRPGTPSARVGHYKYDQELTRRMARQRPGERASVIVMLQPGVDLPVTFRRYVEPNGRLDLINGYALSNVPVSVLPALSGQFGVHRLHYNRSARKQDALSSAAVNANAVDPDHDVAQQTYGYTGQGVTIAVIDSGLTNDVLDDLTDDRVRRFVDFVNPRNVLRTDPSGHGTHVTGIVGGTGARSLGKYAGIAPGASIVSLRVLDEHGQGSISAVLKALNWVYKNARRENIRVVNLSVGAAPTESYFTDPLTLAAKALVDQGITVVAAAGNFGQDAEGRLQWGGITAPGNAPWVLTVCAFSTQGTYGQADDSVAAFSSAGPTAFDFAAKPDLCAPGVGIVSLGAPGSETYNVGLAATPSWVVGPDQRYEYLSGTSMAAPFVSGAIALMLQANPSLTPNLIKGILEYTASARPGVSALRQGAGFMNVAGALSLAGFYASPVAGDTLSIDPAWSRQIIWGNHLLTHGILSPSANAWRLGVQWGAAKTAVLDGDNIVWGTSCDDYCDNIVWGTFDLDDNIVWGTFFDDDNIVWGTDCDDYCDNIVWGTDCDDYCDNIVWGTHFTDDDNIVWGTVDFDDNIVWGTDCGGADCDNVVWGAFSIDDNIVWGTGLFDDNIAWGTIGSFDDNIVWGTLIDDDNIVWGTFLAGDDNIVWGTMLENDDVWQAFLSGLDVLPPAVAGSAEGN
jgi:subtilisin family serine protease